MRESLKYFVLLFLLVICFSCKNEKRKSLETQVETTKFEYPPEWEPHETVWIDIHDQWYNAEAKMNARIEVVEALHEHTPVKILTTTDSLILVIKQKLHNKAVDTSRIEFVKQPLPNHFMRDTGPIFLSNGEELKMANWNWKCLNKWCDDVDMLRGSIDDSIAKKYGYEVVNSKINYEGGGIDINSNTAISIKDYALEQNEFKYTIEEIESEILRLYGKEQMIWLEGIPLIERNGLKIDNYFGQGADGHIDALVRFVNDSTLLVTSISEDDKHKSPIMTHDYDIFQDYIKQLKTHRRQNGKPYTIVEIPFPDVSHHTYSVKAKYVYGLIEQYGLEEQFKPEEDVIMVPIIGYANFLISNDVVLVSEYWEDGLPLSEKAKDEKMKQILKKYFPDKTIKGIKAKTINWDGGGIHCSTQQEPKIE